MDTQLADTGRSHLSLQLNTDLGIGVCWFLLVHWNYGLQRHGNTQYVHHDLRVEINYEGWNETFLDAGVYQFHPGNGEGKKWAGINDQRDFGLKFTFLDNNGLRLPDADVMAGNFKTITGEVIPQIDFHTLGFPDPLPGPFV